MLQHLCWLGQPYQGKRPITAAWLLLAHLGIRAHVSSSLVPAHICSHPSTDQTAVYLCPEARQALLLTSELDPRSWTHAEKVGLLRAR